jgi:hypothetical protein
MRVIDCKHHNKIVFLLFLKMMAGYNKNLLGFVVCNSSPTYFLVRVPEQLY